MNESTIGNILAALDQNDYEVFEELAHVGYLTHTFTWGTYEFTIRTITIDEEIAIGQLIKHLNGVLGQEKAVIAALVAACLVSVNNKYPFPQQPTNDPLVQLRENYRYVSESWHWPVLERINKEYVILQKKANEAVKEIENLSPEGRSMSLESSTDSFDPSKEHPFLAEDPTDFS